MTFEKWFDENYSVATFTNTPGAAMIPMRNAFREVAERSWNAAQVGCGTAELVQALRVFASEADEQDKRNPHASDDLATGRKFTIGEVRAARAILAKFGV